MVELFVVDYNILVIDTSIDCRLLLLSYYQRRRQQEFITYYIIIIILMMVLLRIIIVIFSREKRRGGRHCSPKKIDELGFCCEMLTSGIFTSRSK